MLFALMRSSTAPTESPPLMSLPKRQEVFERYERLVVEHTDEPHEVPSKGDGISAALRNYFRFRVALEALDSVLRERYSDARSPVAVIDYGAFPGTFDKLIRQIYRESLAVTLAGLGFTAAFQDACTAKGITSLDYPDIDQSDLSTSELPATGQGSFDVFLSLNVIEHFLYPTHLLDLANRMLKPDGALIVTTDNISTFSNARRLLAGESSGDHLLRSHLFFRGSHRPHMRIYSKSELMWLLRYAGFRVLQHRYFDARGKEYRVRNHRIERKAIGWSMRFHDVLCRLRPHFSDHHLLTARKSIPFEELDGLRPGPTDSDQEWLELRRWPGMSDPRVS